MKETTQLKMKSQKEISFYPLFSFFITLCCCIFLYFKNGIVPFGKNALLYSDLKAQYAPFIILWKEHLLNLDFSDFISSFTYSGKLGLGKNIMGTLGYYVASPFNLLALFFKNSNIAILINFLVAVKLSFASAFMCLFLEKRIQVSSINNYSFSERSKYPIVLGVLYSFTSYSIVFAFNIMWLDGYLLLPLLLYLLEVYIFENKYVGIAVTLVVLFISNFYIAYMVGIFSFIYLVIRLIELRSEKVFEVNKNVIITKCLKYIAIAVSCALISAVVLFPTAKDILGNQDPVTTLNAQNHILMFPIQNCAEQFFLGRSGDFDYLMHNIPFVFASILTSCSVLIYFLSDEFDKKIKVYRLGGLIFFFLACYIRVINLACHIFDTPNWFNHRFSFVIYPLLIMITLEVLLKVKSIKNRDILISMSVLIVILIMTKLLPGMSIDNQPFFISLALLVGYSALMCLYKINNWHPQLKDMPKLLPVFIAVAIVVESGLINTRLINHSFFIPDLNGDVLSESISKLEPMMGKLESDKPYTRAEYESISDGECIPESMWGQVNLYTNSNGISLFSTTYNKELGRFLKQLGYSVNYSYFMVYYNYMMPANDAFFALDKVVSTNDYSLADFSNAAHIVTSENTKEFGIQGIDYKLYTNTRILPLAFPVDNKADEFDFYSLEHAVSSKNYFTFNEAWYQSMFPEAFDSSYFTIIDEDMISGPQVIDGTSYVAVNSVNDLKMRTEYTDKLGEENFSDHMNVVTNYAPAETGKPVIVKYEFVMPQSGELYFNLSSPALSNDYTISVNGVDVINFVEKFSTINRIGYFNSGDSITLELKANEGIAITDVYFAIFDQTSFNEQFDRIDTTAVNIDRFTDGHAELMVDTSKTNSNSLVLSTIPYEDGWTCYIDGKKAEITPYQNALLAVDLDKNNVNDGAQHKIEFKFCAPGFKLGAISSLIGIVLIIAICLYDKLICKKNNKLVLLEKVE